ncbi:MAG TPA: cobyrinate a,c-diamide synthase, partial [Polyangia bacterium]|nr:cobyrinate a,c-diamide synthase [Polyangia bacterium]
MARTIAAVGVGLRAFDPALRLAGLVANRLGSRGHLDLLKRACLPHVPVMGGLPRDAARAFPERHLGLRTADSDVVPDALVDAWAATFAEWNDVDAWLALARSAPPLDAPVAEPAAVVGPTARRCRIAIARDAAFHFYYEDNLARLASLGAELVPFSPLADARLPAADGVYLGGGYPEAHAAQLAANEPMRAALRDFAARGGPIYAECGGLMYLADAIRTLDGTTHPMLGLVAGTAVMHDRLQSLGYVEVETQRRTLLGGAGLRMRGHQFRYSTLQGGSGDAYNIRKRRGGTVEAEGYGAGNILGSYVHVHWASNPLVAEGFVTACSRFAEERSL